MSSFVPHREEEIVVVKISKKEAHLIQKLRRHAYGKIVIHKANNVLLRMELTSSEMLDDEAEIDLV